MITSRQQQYLDSNTLIIEGRDDIKYRGFPLKTKDAPKAIKRLPQVLNFLMLHDVSEVLFRGYQNRNYEANDQYEALCEIITFATEKPDAIKDFDLQMAKVVVLNYINMFRRGYMKTIQCGTKVIDREGNEFTAYSYKLADYEKAMELLSQVDIINTVTNCDTDQTGESYNAMIEIIFLSLNEKVDKATIEKSIDAEFSRKCLRIYYDLDQLF